MSDNIFTVRVLPPSGATYFMDNTLLPCYRRGAVPDIRRQQQSDGRERKLSKYSNIFLQFTKRQNWIIKRTEIM